MAEIVLSIVIPVYNEEASIKKVIEEHVKIIQACDDFIKDWEILCLDDASIDNSYAILKKCALNNIRIHILRHEHNQGIAGSFHDLFHAAQGTHVYVTAADDQWPAKNLKILLSSLYNNSYDLVIGVRENRKEIYSVWRRILSFGFNFIPEILYKVKTKDANGIKLGKRELFTLKLQSKSFFAEIERIIEAKKGGAHIGFESIEFLTRCAGKAKGAKWKNIFASLKDMGRYILNSQSCHSRGSLD